MSRDIDVVFDCERHTVQRQRTRVGVALDTRRVRHHHFRRNSMYPRMVAIAFTSCVECIARDLRRCKRSAAQALPQLR
jgi:hypothetical protein